MSRLGPDILRALTDGVTTGPELVPGAMRILAIDRAETWAAAFRFRVYEDGNWVNDTVLLRQLEDETWEDMTSGGASGSGWRLPWVVPSEGWNGDLMTLVSRNGLVVDLRSGAEVDLSAVSGFAGSGVAAVRVSTRHDDHFAPVVPPANAVVALMLGPGTLTPVDEQRKPLGPPRAVT